MTHISKELAEWLKERACSVEPTAYYYRCRGGSNVRLKDCVWGEWKFVVGRIDWEAMIVDDGINPREEQCLPAYSWYDILVTHAKEFWDEIVWYGRESNVPVCEACGEDLLHFLQQGKTQEAEEYVKTHSLFAKQDL